MSWPISSYVANNVIWVALWSALFGWQAYAMATRPRFPSFGDLLFALQRLRLFRLLLFAGWAWLGWHVFIRGDW